MAATPGQHPMAGQVMEAQAHQQRPPMTLPHLPPNCKNDLLLTTMPTTSASNTITTAATTAAEIAYFQQLQNTAAEANNNGGGTRGEQCPRCASHDTKFCYYNNYNTSQPRHFCRACRRYWTLGGSLRNVPIGGSTRKRPRFAHAPPPPARRLPAHVFGLDGGGSLFALGAAPLLEGRGGAGSFDLGLGLPPAAPFSAGGEVGLQVPQGLLGLRGGGGAAGASPLFWPAGLLENDGVDTWKVAGASAGGAMWPEFSAAAGPAQAGGLLHGGAQLM